MLKMIPSDCYSSSKRRKLKECQLLVSHATRIREFNRSIGKLQFFIQAI